MGRVLATIDGAVKGSGLTPRQVQVKEFAGDPERVLIDTRQGHLAAADTALDEEGARELADKLLAWVNRPKEQVFTVTIVVHDHVVRTQGKMNIHQAKNHLRKYVAEKLGIGPDYVLGYVKEGGEKPA